MARGPRRPASGRNQGAGAPDASLQKDLVLMGEFGRAHGLKGEVRLKSHTGDPLAIASYGPLRTADGRSVTLRSVRQAAGDQPDLLVAQVEGVGTREAAEALNRVGLYLPRERLGEPEGEDEYFLADLIGLAVRSEAGETVGTVVAVPNYGGGDLLEIAPPRGPTILVPFMKDFVPAVDLEGGFVTVAEGALSPGEVAEPESAEEAGP
ncbi:ribosome maturation factor RimM [Enterovirga aerilata]|uniref:Ribosome maturation factor RimM n=1 Tax=Enterovirga aerilata TaxID=2730920 RepID=A0A849IFP5_9HYPH|nr:ribosome maturation factor RimM [Enterovirga sp. DB1703]